MTEGNETGNVPTELTTDSSSLPPVAGRPQEDLASEPDEPKTEGSHLAGRLEGARAAVARLRRDGASPRVAATLVLLLVLATVLGALQWRRAGGLASDAKTQRDIATTAAAFGEALLSYDFDDLSAARDRVVNLATEDFGKSYSETFRAGLRTIITRLKATAEATVRDVYVTEASADKAKAMVVLDSKVRSSAGVRELVGSYLEMELRREGGTWKVDAVTAVAAAQETVTKPSPRPKG